MLKKCGPTFAEIVKAAMWDPFYNEEKYKVTASELLYKEMENQGLTYETLAKKLEWNLDDVIAFFSCNNTELTQIAEMACLLKVKLTFTIKKES